MIRTLHVLQFVEAKSSLTTSAINQRVTESLLVPAVFPDQAILDNRRIQALDVVALVNQPAPPGLFDIVRQFYAERTVIPTAAKTAVNFRCRKNKASAL